MSRIAGLVYHDAPERNADALALMLKSLMTSATDVQVKYAQPSAQLGFCGWRTANAVQRQDITVVMDGTIYNRAEFESAETDACLFLDLFLKNGFEGALKKINGDFSVALYDSRDQTLWLGRDRFGVKPLFFAKGPGYFAFASRPAALLALPGIKRDVNRQFVALFAASHYRYFDNDPAKSPFADIQQLPAAQYLRWRRGQWTKNVYWSAQELPDFEEPAEVLAQKYKALLWDAVSIRTKSAGHTAFTLSGGMDSSSVLALAVAHSGRKQHAFSTVYRDKTYDETEEIQTMLDQTVSEWHRILIDRPPVAELVRDMVLCHDEPVATATWLSHYVLCREAKSRGFTSLFGGLGGDELNAGEYEYYYYFFADLQAAHCDADLRHEAGLWAQYHDHPIYKKSYDLMQKELNLMVDFSVPGHCIPYQKRSLRYAQTLNPDYFDLKRFKPVMEHPFRSYLKNRTFQDLTRETAPCCLRALDRQASAFQLENHLPFFDHRLFEFMFRVPGTLKIRDGITKHLLREAMKGVLPEETRTRIKKTGWNAPAHLWFSGKNRDFLMDLVHSKIFRERGIYHVEEVLRLIDEHESIVSSGRPQENHMMFFWQLVNLETWFREYSDICSHENNKERLINSATNSNHCTKN
jgi:asparagine synthase (glutamine-hydrolysing)